MKKTWIFQGSMKYFDIDSYIHEMKELCWSVNQHTREVSRGDEVYILRAQAGTDKPSALIARAEVLCDPEEKEEPENCRRFRLAPEDETVRLRVDLKILEKAENEQEELLKLELKDDPLLGELAIFKIANKTNFPVPSEAQVKRLKELWNQRSSSLFVENTLGKLSKLNRDDLIKSIKYIDEFGTEGFGASQFYDVLYEGKRYPPKAIFGIAAKNILGRILSPAEFKGGENTFCFDTIKKNGFEIISKNSNTEKRNLASISPSDEEYTTDEVRLLILEFVTNSLNIKGGKASLKSAHYSKKKYRGLNIRASFGQGNFASVPWIAFLGYDQSVPEGIYPVILFSALGNKKSLEICYGVSATNKPKTVWPKRIIDGHAQSETDSYPESFIKSSYAIIEIRDLERNIQDIISNLDEVITTYHNVFYDAPNIKKSMQSLKSYSSANIVDDGCFLSQKRINDILARLEEKKNIVLQGAPGTGKSWLAKKLGYALIGRVEEQNLRVVQFHPNLSYEDFVRGYRPTSEGKLAVIDGIFLEMVFSAQKNRAGKFVIVIEEINRGSPAQIFGELLTLLENGKRDSAEALELCYPDADGARRKIYIPQNLYVIGTMNIADRSIAIVDFALRRRFAFIELEPSLGSEWQEWVIKNCGLDDKLAHEIAKRMSTLNEAISSDPRLGKHFRIGHSYVTPSFFLPPGESEKWFRHVVETEIGPLLEEYWFDSSEEARKAKALLLQGL